MTPSGRRPGGSAPAPPLPTTFGEAVAAVQARGRFGVRLGLARTRALLRALGSPERDVRGALIGGTNGKGSVVALVSACLDAAGRRAGDTPKPHLVTYRERLRIGGRPIDAASFTELVRAVLPAADAVARRHGPPTEFELVTALAFAWFAREAVDLAVVEVGLGGRLDATHAWDGGVAAITNVDLDHTEWLGPTVDRDRPREGRDHRPRRPGGHRRHGGRRWACSGRVRDGSASTSSRRRRRPCWPWTGAACSWSCPGSGPRGSACWGGTRRRTWPSRTRCSTRWGRRGSPRCRRRRGAPAMPPLAGPGAWS